MLRTRHTNFARSLTCLSIFATLFLFAERAKAQTDIWTNAASSTWNTAGNWAGGIPGSSSVATFSVNPASTAAITIDGTVNAAVAAINPLSAHTQTSLNVFNVAGDAATLTLSGATLNGQANTIIYNQLPYNSTTKSIDFLNNTTGSLGISLGTTGGAVIQGVTGGSSSKAANITYIAGNISGTGPLTFLGGGVNDLTYNATGFDGGTLELAGTNSWTGGMTIGSPNAAGVPDYGKQGQVQIDAVSALPSGTYTITVNNNSVLFLQSAGAMNFSNAGITYVINGLGNGWNSGALRTKSPSMQIAGSIVLGSDAVITNATGGNFYTYQGPITGAHILQFQGAGTASLTATGNNWGSTQIGNGAVVVTSGGSFSTGALNFAQTSTNTPTITFNQPTQTVNGLFGSLTGNGLNKLVLNGTRLTINQTIAGSFGAVPTGTVTAVSTIEGNGSIVKTGSASLTLVQSGAVAVSLSGGLKVSQGDLIFAPTSSYTFYMPAPDTLDGGNIRTTGIGASSTVTLNALTVTNNSGIYLESSVSNRIMFANSSSRVWTPSTMLTIYGWQGNYAGGTSGSAGQIFFGSDATGLTASQLAQIQFFDGTSNHPAVLLSTGELVPSPSITTTSASFGPFCNGTSNNISVAYTTAGTMTGTYSLQISNAAGSFGTFSVIGTGASPITGTIPAGFAAGTGYRVRVVNSVPAVSGTDNGSDITINAAPAAYAVTGGGGYCPGGAGVDVQVSNSQTGINYQLYRGATTVGGAHAGTTGLAVDFGNQTVAGVYTVLATNATTGCTTAMTGSATVSLNSVPGITVTGTTLITPGSTATITFNDTASVDGDVVTFTDGVGTYTVSPFHGTIDYTTPALSSTTVYSVTGAVSALGCSVTPVGQYATVYVSATPTAIINGGIMICPGGTTSVDLTITGTASGVVRYTDGVSTYTVTLSSGSGGVGTADVFFSPTSTTTYSLIDINSAGTYTLSGSTVISISPLPTVFNVTGSGGYCPGSAGVVIGLDGSDNGSVNYQLWDGVTAIGSPVPGTTGAISFGTYSTITTYTVQATNSIGCTSNMAGGATVSVNPVPTAYAVTGTGSYCAGGSGLALGLANSQTGVNYLLYKGAVAVSSSMPGTTGLPISFGTYTAAGTYTAVATSTLGCMNNMTGSAVISINPLPVPGTITGSSELSVSGSVTLSDATAVGTSTMWSSSSSSVATIGSGSGVVTGASAGTTTISYAVTNSCGTLYATKVITVDAVSIGEVVMSQVYGGGGRTGSTYNTEFVELFNSSSSPVVMTNWSIQYEAAGGGGFGVNTFSGTIAAHSYFLIAMHGGPTGAAIPTPDASPASASNLNNINGIVALVANSNAITVPSGDVTSSMASQYIVDFVGYGSAVSFLGSAAAPATSVASADFRLLNGCYNTQNNGNDFGTPATPAPRNSASGTNICPTATDYYSKSTGNLDAAATWGTNTDGSGTAPADFTGALSTYHVANGNSGAISGSSWTVSGIASSISVDAGTDLSVTTKPVNGKINVGAGRTLTLANSTLPTFGSFNATSTLIYSNLGSIAIPGGSFGNITFANTNATSSTGTNTAVSFAGNFLLTGTSVYTEGGLDLVANGSANQVIDGNGTTVEVNNFDASKPSGTLSIAAGTTMKVDINIVMSLFGGPTNAFIDNGNTLILGHQINFDGTASSYNLTGTIISDGSLATGSNSNIRGGSASNYPCKAHLHNVICNSSIPIQVNGGQPGTGLRDTLYIDGDLLISASEVSPVKFYETGGAGNTIALGGNFADSTTTGKTDMASAGSVLMFVGSGNQTYFSNVSGGSSFTNVTMAKTGGSLTLQSGMTVSDSLLMLGGVINTGSNTLTIQNGAGVYGANTSSYVNGNLLKNLPSSGGVSSLAFEVGDATYSPVKLTFGTNIISGGIKVSSTQGAHPQFGTSYINSANDVNRFWTITDLGTTASGTTVNVALSYNAGDETGSGNTGYSMRQYTTGWSTMPSVTNTTSASSPLLANATTSTGAAGSSLSADYVVGAPDCTGATGGTANASVTSICGTGSSNLSLSGSSSGPGITYQWQSSSDGSSYAPISGATSATYSASGISSTTYYNCVIGCLSTGTNSSSASVTVSANPVPTVGTTGGGVAICLGTTATLSGTGATSYSWTGSVVDGVAFTPTTGIHNYTVTGTTAGCSNTATTSLTVNATATGTITGPSFVAVGSNINLTDALGGGTWSASNGNATVTGGLVHGVTAGTVTISYNVTGICGAAAATQLVTVGTGTVSVAAITGYYFYLCQNSTASFFDATPGGVWSVDPSAASVASISAAGVVTGLSAGTARISYTVGSNFATAVTTVYPVPAAITGSASVCPGATTALTSTTTGGVWSSGIPSTASVGTSGVVTGTNPGTTPIYYTLTAPAGCKTSVMVTVNPNPGAITGPTSVCAGASISLSDATTGGVFSSASGTVSVTGTSVTGISTGTAVVTYMLTTGCYKTTTLAVNGVSAGSISGAASVSVGANITLSDAATGGVWSASNGNATVSGGVVTGVAAGTVTISYTVTNSCGSASATQVITVNPSGLGGITGALGVCSGLTTALTDATPGGTWHSGNTMIATVGTGGLVTASSTNTGTVTISYTVGGVVTSAVVTVNPNPSGIGGANSVCSGSSITLSDLITGGAWSSTPEVSVTTGASVTTVTTNSVGTGTVTYSLPTGCYRTYNVTVKALPTAILGNLNVCGVGGVTFLSDATAGTGWTISPVTTATVSASGRVYGVATGTATVTYTSTNTCVTTSTVTVNALVTVAAISGATNVSHGATITLSDLTPGGVWSSSNPALGSVDATGDVTGVGASGTVTISYALSYAGGGCTALATKPITVHTPAPPTHGGTISTTAGSVVTMEGEEVSGIWTSSNTSVATVENGVITAIAIGTTDITHTITNSNGDVSTSVTPVIVNALPIDVKVIPNPNSGVFTVKGSMGTTQDVEVTMDVTDMLGQIVYSKKIVAAEGKINETIAMINQLANGMYMLNMHTGNENKTFHFVIEK